MTKQYSPEAEIKSYFNEFFFNQNNINRWNEMYQPINGNWLNIRNQCWKERLYPNSRKWLFAKPRPILNKQCYWVN